MANENYKNKIEVLRRACSSQEQKAAFWKDVEAKLNNKIDEHIIENKAFEREFDCEIETCFANYPIILTCNFQFNPSENNRWNTKMTVSDYDTIFDEPFYKKIDDEEDDDFDNLTIWSRIVSFPQNNRMLMPDGDLLLEIEEFLKKDEIVNSEIVSEQVRKANTQIEIIKKGGNNTGQTWFALSQLIDQIEGKTQKIYMGKTIIEYINKAVDNQPINQERPKKATETNLKNSDIKREVINASIIYAYSSGVNFKNPYELARQLATNFSVLCRRERHLRNKLLEIFPSKNPTSSRKKFIIPISTLVGYIPKFETEEFKQLVAKAQNIDSDAAQESLINLLKQNK